jgi:hypothetical protein
MTADDLRARFESLSQDQSLVERPNTTKTEE